MALVPCSFPLIVQKSRKNQRAPNFCSHSQNVHTFYPLHPSLPWPLPPNSQSIKGFSGMTWLHGVSVKFTGICHKCLFGGATNFWGGKKAFQFNSVSVRSWGHFFCHILNWKCHIRLLKIHPNPAWWVEVKCSPVLVRFKYSIFLSLSLLPPPPNCPHWAVWTGCTAWLGSAGLPCGFYLYFMLWRCAQTATHPQWGDLKRTPKECQQGKMNLEISQASSHICLDMKDYKARLNV